MQKLGDLLQDRCNKLHSQVNAKEN